MAQSTGRGTRRPAKRTARPACRESNARKTNAVIPLHVNIQVTHFERYERLRPVNTNCLYDRKNKHNLKFRG